MEPSKPLNASKEASQALKEASKPLKAWTKSLRPRPRRLRSLRRFEGGFEAFVLTLEAFEGFLPFGGAPPPRPPPPSTLGPSKASKASKVSSRKGPGNQPRRKSLKQTSRMMPENLQASSCIQVCQDDAISSSCCTTSFWKHHPRHHCGNLDWDASMQCDDKLPLSELLLKDFHECPAALAKASWKRMQLLETRPCLLEVVSATSKNT